MTAQLVDEGAADGVVVVVVVVLVVVVADIVVTVRAGGQEMMDSHQATAEVVAGAMATAGAYVATDTLAVVVAIKLGLVVLGIAHHHVNQQHDALGYGQHVSIGCA